MNDLSSAINHRQTDNNNKGRYGCMETHMVLSAGFLNVQIKSPAQREIHKGQRGRIFCSVVVVIATRRPINPFTHTVGTFSFFHLTPLFPTHPPFVTTPKQKRRESTRSLFWGPLISTKRGKIRGGWCTIANPFPHKGKRGVVCQPAWAAA